MAATAKEGSEAFKAFLKLVNSIGPKIKTQSNEVPILYKGSQAGTAVYKLIEAEQRRWADKNKVSGNFTMITDVLARLPSPVPHYSSMLDFANSAARKGGISVDEGEDVWEILSAYYAKNCGSNAMVWFGRSMAKSSILTTIELPMLLYNRKICRMKRETIKRYLEILEKRQNEIGQIDKDFREFYAALQKRNKLLRDYDLVDQITKFWN